eukprot:CAMPEP_0118883298 /NCGR_PEP_ID=MMETSP1163-20130328/22381_1 /TAXON_ID=124430 /ORGANISM="Phaeomonas parva, Strain CCMP2877" /LENGTH=45 /DNA_ID= /DNA_START= /DNA_END= /DNA_ORIENTATION=
MKRTLESTGKGGLDWDCVAAYLLAHLGVQRSDLAARAAPPGRDIA